MEEKIDYRLEERTSDIHDLLENCQTRVCDKAVVGELVTFSTLVMVRGSNPYQIQREHSLTYMFYLKASRLG